MNRVLGFAGTVAVIVIALVLLAGCGLTTILAYQWLSPDVTQVTVDEPIVVNPNSHAGGEAAICEFANGYTSDGKTVPAGTKVEGPAFAKPNRNISWGYPIYIGEEYTTKTSDEVIWLLKGDNACVDAQGQFFTLWGKQ